MCVALWLQLYVEMCGERENNMIFRQRTYSNHTCFYLYIYWYILLDRSTIRQREAMPLWRTIGKKQIKGLSHHAILVLTQWIPLFTTISPFIFAWPRWLGLTILLLDESLDSIALSHPSMRWISDAHSRSSEASSRVAISGISSLCLPFTSGINSQEFSLATMHWIDENIH